ncbi:MAG: SWIM zinc finger family protein, partial [Lachnospiraceae bacterium]|nr:SWIM zinc finger family protein [Lachnospiraceae bacterium]
MDWKNKFADYILERGRIYYKQKRVQHLIYENEVYYAKVQGSRRYRVQIRVKNDEITRMECSCPYGALGIPCKHMAAALFAIDEKGAELTAAMMMPEPEVKKVNPFRVSEDVYQYFDMGRMAKEMEVTEKLLSEARQLVQKEMVVLDEVSIGYNGFVSTKSISGIARGYSVNAGQDAQLSVIFDRESVLRASCCVPRCGGNYGGDYYYYEKGICKHLLALLILLDEYLKRFNPGDSTDRSAEVLFDRFR